MSHHPAEDLVGEGGQLPRVAQARPVLTGVRPLLLRWLVPLQSAIWAAT